MMRPFQHSILWLLLSLCACAKARPLDRQELKRNFLRTGRLELCYSAESGSPIESLAQRLKHEIELRESFPGEVSLGPSGSVAKGAGARLCIGLVDEQPLMELLAPLGVEAVEGGFRWRGRLHNQPSDALLACLPDPERPGLPLMVLVGVEPTALARRELRLPAPWIPSLRTWQAGAPGVLTELELDGTTRESSLRDLGAARSRLAFLAARKLDAQVQYHAPRSLDAARLETYLAACRRARRWVETEFQATLSAPIELWLYHHTEDMQLALGRAQLSYVDRGSLQVHALLAPGVPDDGGAGLARAIALALAGVPREAALLDVVGSLAAGTWWGRELPDWFAHVRQAGMLVEPQNAFAKGAEERYSVHRLAVSRAHHWSAENEAGAGRESGSLAQAWGTDAGSAEPAAWTMWYAYPEVPLAARRKSIIQTRWRGVALFDAPSPSGASLYATRAVDAALDEAKALGANGFSMTLPVWQGDPEAWLSGIRAGAWGAASDAELASAIAAGRGRGMGSMLVLDPLLGAGLGRLDKGALNTGEGQREFLQRMQLFCLHYGLLGELLGIEILCLGTSLDQSTSTLAHANDAGKPVRQKRKTQLQKGWREIVGRLRPAYAGALTYGAHLGQPLYQVGFWKELDFVGMLGFGPHSQAGFEQGGAGLDEATLDIEIARELRKGAQFLKKTGKQPLFIQLGFPARDGSWDGWSSSRGAPDPGAQERYYAALARGIQRVEQRAQPLNFFLWNWSLSESATPGAVGDYSIRGRLPSETLARILGKH